MNKVDRILKWFFSEKLYSCIQSRSFKGVMCDPVTATLLVVGTAMSAMSAAESYKQSKRQAKATAQEGALKAAEREKQTRRLAASQKTSFLSSGISLTGEDSDLPNVVMQDTFATGLQDISLIKSNYNQQSKNIMGAARAKLVSDIGGMALNIGMAGAMGGMGGGGGTQSMSSIGDIGIPSWSNVSIPSGSTVSRGYTGF